MGPIEFPADQELDVLSALVDVALDLLGLLTLDVYPQLLPLPDPDPAQHLQEAGLARLSQDQVVHAQAPAGDLPTVVVIATFHSLDPQIIIM